MINCPCGFGNNLSDETKSCPVCGMDLAPLSRLRDLPGRYRTLGAKEAEQGRLEEAEPLLAAALAMDPGSAAACVALGKVYAGRGRYEEAGAQFEKALALESGNAGAAEEKQKAEEAAAARREAAAQKEITLREQEARLRRQAGRLDSLKGWIAAAALLALLAGFLIPAAVRQANRVPASQLAEKIAADYAASDLLGNAGLSVSAGEDGIRIEGQVSDAAYKSLALQIAESYTDGEPVDGSGLTVVPPETEEEQPVTYPYTVKRGDTLSKLATFFYGDAGQWGRIWEANRDILGDGSTIRTGQVLKIPVQ